MREGLVPLTDLPSHLPPGRRGKSLHRAVPWRWARIGVKAPDGEIVHLESVRVGRRWMTSLKAVARFIARTTPGVRVASDLVEKAPTPIREETRASLHRFGLSRGDGKGDA